VSSTRNAMTLRDAQRLVDVAHASAHHRQPSITRELLCTS
jgi:hypothetical protein